MRLRTIIKADKTNVRLEGWKQGNMQPSAFQIRKNLKTVHQGKSNYWRVITFEALGKSFRVLVLYNPDREIYRATLGIEDGGQVSIVCVREFHASEPGWHCHADLECSRNVSMWNHHDLIRFPRKPKLTATYGVTSQERATELALKFYRISERGPLV